MVTKELLEHIKNQLASGKTYPDIKQELISGGGWSASDIDEAFRVINSAPIKRSVAPYVFAIQLITPACPPAPLICGHRDST